MRLFTMSLGLLVSFSVAAKDHGGGSSPAPSAKQQEPRRNLEKVPFVKLNHEDSERIGRELADYLSSEVQDDIKSMKRKRPETYDREGIQALECLSKNMSLYIRGADDLGLELYRAIPSQKITPEKFKAFFKTISNSIRQQHNQDE
jgi:hypothetical protein